MSKIRLPLVFDGLTDEAMAEDKVNFEKKYEVTATEIPGDHNGEHVIEGAEVNIVRMLVDYFSNIVIEGETRFNLEEFIFGLKGIEPPLEDTSWRLLTGINIEFPAYDEDEERNNAARRAQLRNEE